MAYVPITGAALTALESKPNAGLAATQQGFFIGQYDNVWMIEEIDGNTLANFATWIAAFNDIAYAKARAKERVAEEMLRRLNAAEVQGMQITLMMRVLRLQVKNSGLAFASWPAADRNKVNAANARLIKIDGIGDAAEAIAADIDALTDAYAIAGFDIAGSTRWPAI